MSKTPSLTHAVDLQTAADYLEMARRKLYDAGEPGLARRLSAVISEVSITRTTRRTTNPVVSYTPPLDHH
jgi:hypothetical protein